LYFCSICKVSPALGGIQPTASWTAATGMAAIAIDGLERINRWIQIAMTNGSN
jgi:hypothetical protein